MRLADHQTRHGTRSRYEKGCRCDACREAKSRRNAHYRELHGNEIAANGAHVRASPQPRTAPGIVGVYYVPKVSKARPWRAQIGANKRVIHLGMSPRRRKLRPPNDVSAKLVDARWTSRLETRVRKRLQEYVV